MERLGRARAHRALGSGRTGTQCLLLQVGRNPVPWTEETPGLWSPDTGAPLLLVLTFRVTVLFLFFFLLQAGLLLLLLLEQPLLQFLFLVRLQQQVGEWARGCAGGARLGWLVGWGAGIELLLG